MGKTLTKMQKEHKRQQKEVPDDERQTWKDYCAQERSARPTFPVYQDAAKYVLVAKYPGAYQKDARGTFPAYLVIARSV